MKRQKHPVEQGAACAFDALIAALAIMLGGALLIISMYGGS